jgi:phenylalanine-4-hydroxylase
MQPAGVYIAQTEEEVAMSTELQRPEGAAPDWTIDQGWDAYTPEEHATWLTLYDRQASVLPGRAADAFIHGLHALDLRGEGVPDFRVISERLQKLTGWSVVAVPGLVPDDVFFDHLANRRFPAGNFIRRPTSSTTCRSPTSSTTSTGTCPC